MATPGTRLANLSEEIMLPKEDKSVLDVVARYRSIPFLLLTAKVHLGETELERIIDNLESWEMVKVLNRSDVSEKIVTVEKKGLAAAA